MHMGSSPIVRTNKKKTPPIGGGVFLLARSLGPRTPAALQNFKICS